LKIFFSSRWTRWLKVAAPASLRNFQADCPRAFYLVSEIIFRRTVNRSHARRPDSPRIFVPQGLGITLLGHYPRGIPRAPLCTTRRSSSTNILRHHHQRHECTRPTYTAITIRWWIHAGGETGEDRAFHGSGSSGKDVERTTSNQDFLSFKTKMLWSVRIIIDHKNLNFSNILITPENPTDRS